MLPFTCLYKSYCVHTFKINDHQFSSNFSIRISKEQLILKSKFRFSSGMRFADMRFADVKFTGVKFAGVKFADVKFAGVRFAGVRFAGVRFVDVRFTNMRFFNVRFADVLFVIDAIFEAAVADILKEVFPKIAS